LHADHEQNCSTSTCEWSRLQGRELLRALSARFRPWGPRTAAPTEGVIEMLEAIQEEAGNYQHFLG